jgi:hypothetical protein
VSYIKAIDSHILLSGHKEIILKPKPPLHRLLKFQITLNMSAKTAIIITDPYNDFLHPKGKLYGMLAESLAEKDTHKHLKELVDAARAHHIPIYYGLHQQHKPGFLVGWKHATKLQESQAQSTVFAEGSWGVEIYEGLEPQVSNGDVIVSKHWSSRYICALKELEGVGANTYKLISKYGYGLSASTA